MASSRAGPRSRIVSPRSWPRSRISPIAMSATSSRGDAFADEWVFVGTHTGPLQLPDGTELAATGKRVEMPGMELVEVRDGKIVVDNLYYDNLAVAAQFGLLPQPTTPS